jgi:hypothetical protein
LSVVAAKLVLGGFVRVQSAEAVFGVEDPEAAVTGDMVAICKQRALVVENRFPIASRLSLIISGLIPPPGTWPRPAYLSALAAHC